MAEDLGFHKKRRKVVRASLTKLSTKVTDLESNPSAPGVLESAQNLSKKLKTLEEDFKTHQLKIMDLTDAEESLIDEQQALDDNDDIVSELSIRIQRLVTSATPSMTTDAKKIVAKHC